MSKRTWLLVGLALGGGILLQIPEWGSHAEHHAGDGHDHASVAEMEAMVEVTAMGDQENASTPTVALEVTGMT